MVVLLKPETVLAVRDFQIGGFSGATFSVLLPAGILIAIGVIVVMLFSGELEILSLGEPTALSLGLNVRFFRFLFLILAACLAGAAISFSGLLGFVGLIVPHISRLLLKNASKRILILQSAVLGAVFLVICDTFSRTAFSPFELPVGIPVAFVGVPFFLWLIFKGRRKKHD
jgi:iron complex transport system permease protein